MICPQKGKNILLLYNYSLERKKCFVAVCFVFRKGKLFCSSVICLWKGKMSLLLYDLSLKKMLSLQYDMSDTEQNFTLPRTLQLAPHKPQALDRVILPADNKKICRSNRRQR